MHQPHLPIPKQSIIQKLCTWCPCLLRHLGSSSAACGQKQARSQCQMRHALCTQFLRSNISDDAGALHVVQAEPMAMAAATAEQPCQCAEGLGGGRQQATAASSEPEPGTEPEPEPQSTPELPEAGTVGPADPEPTSSTASTCYDSPVDEEVGSASACYHAVGMGSAVHSSHIRMMC